jgi:hypothetical protein
VVKIGYLTFVEREDNGQSVLVPQILKNVKKFYGSKKLCIFASLKQ